jgi:hypothetical protein
MCLIKVEYLELARAGLTELYFIVGFCKFFEVLHQHFEPNL